MAKNAYHWSKAEDPPLIDYHSVAKHRVLDGYLRRYVEVLASNHKVEALRINLIDGFSGGGLYRLPGNGGIHEGSPLVFLRSMKEAEAAIRCSRIKEFKVDARFYFVETERRYLEYLKETIAERFSPDAGNGGRIHFINGDFDSNVDRIVAAIKSRGKAHRSIFLLDQYGYVDVPLPLLRNIFLNLPKAEVILTFAVDSLIDYLSDTPQLKSAIKRLGVDGDLDLAKIEKLKAVSSDWRFLIQSQLHRALVKGAGASFFTPFFIISRQSGRSYWLVHLSNHVKARDEMAKLHWQMHTFFTHHGGAGLNMLGYDPKRDANLTGQPFVFDQEAKILTEESLMVDIPKIISANPEGKTFDELLAETCNGTPATSEIYKNAIGALILYKELEVKGVQGERRRAANRIQGGDVITLASQRQIFDFISAKVPRSPVR
jgi:three-Cys-motif partner protein